MNDDSSTLLIEHVTVVSPERTAPLPDASVLIRNGQIAWIGTRRPLVTAGIVRLDGRGRYLVPGFIDAHVHVGHAALFAERHYNEKSDLIAAYHAQVPRSYLYHGFTTLLDPDLTASDAERFQSSAVTPRLISCRRGLRYFDGYGPALFPRQAREKIFPVWVFDSTQLSLLPRGTDLARHAPESIVAKQSQEGAGCVKTYHESGFGGVANWPTPSIALLRRTVRAAHAAGVPALLHATGLDGYRAGLDAGVDVFMHGLWHWPGSRLDTVPTSEVLDVIRSVAREGRAVQPTFRVLYGEGETWQWHRVNDPQLSAVLPTEIVAWLQTPDGRWAQEELQSLYARLTPDARISPERYIDAMNARVRATSLAMYRAGVPLLFGSDTPAAEGVGNVPGLNGLLEIAAWWDVGIRPRDILYALTLGNAKRFGMADSLGSITKGKVADLLLLSHNPLETIDAYRNIETVIVGGTPYERDTFSSTARVPESR